MRIGFALIATQLLNLTGLLLAGGLLLLWVCWKMYQELRAGHVVEEAAAVEALAGERPRRRRHGGRPARRARRCARR